MDNPMIKQAAAKLGIAKLTDEQTMALLSIRNMVDTLVLLPTGSGKSLIFQLAPYLWEEEEVTVVILAPLNTIIDSQVAKLCEAGFRAVKASKAQHLADPHISHVFTSPAFFSNEMCEKGLISKLKCRAIFVDESHCVVDWGEKGTKTEAFRHAYSRIGDWRCVVPEAVMVALTATATATMQERICRSLRIAHTRSLVRVNPNRSNIRYSVVRVSELAPKNSQYDSGVERAFTWLVKLLNRKKEECPRVLIFCRVLDYVGDIYRFVSSECPLRFVEQFHKQTTDTKKGEIIQRFQDPISSLRIVICSTSFSMGLDFKQLFTAVHFGPPASIDEYMQESGRVARGGGQGHSIIIRHKDCLKGENISKEIKEYMNLTTASCRRSYICKYFGYNMPEGGDPSVCCDICDSDTKCQSIMFQ